MKNIFKLSFLSLLLLTVISCNDDDNKTVPAANSAPVLISPEDGTAVVLTEGLEANTALTLVWNHGDYDVDTSINYDIQFAVAGTDFAAPVSAGTTTKRVFSMTVGELNTLATAEDKLNLPAFEATELEVRVISSLGIHDEMPMISNTLAITVTPFEKIVVEEPKLYVIGAPQAYYGLSAWSPQTGMSMRYIGDGTTKVFEAYVKVGAGDGLKFGAVQGEWSDVDAAGNYGMGDAPGTIKNSGGAANVELAATEGEGLYYVQVDLDALTFKSIKMSWGIIGDATPGGWSDETPMNYDFATNKWTLTADLTAADMKYRSANTGNFIYAGEDNSAWKFNVGNSDPKVTYNAAAPNFSITTAGSHNLELTINFDGTATSAGE